MGAYIIQIIVNTLYILALINPISKVSVLCSVYEEKEGSCFLGVTNKASIVGAVILLGSMLFGDLLLSFIFRIELYSLRFSGGVVMFWIGFNALRRGVFFEQSTPFKFEEAALVPLACPMIAGPTTIAASITLQVEEGFVLSAISVLLAVAVNHFIMRLSRPIGRTLSNFNIMGAMIRITGLIVMTIGTQMILDGIATWWLTA